jgi:hypothetical protein
METLKYSAAKRSFLINKNSGEGKMSVYTSFEQKTHPSPFFFFFFHLFFFFPTLPPTSHPPKIVTNVCRMAALSALDALPNGFPPVFIGAFTFG